MIGTTDTLQYPSSVVPTSEPAKRGDFAPVRATYEGCPVFYNEKADELAYEGLQEGQLLPIPKTSERTIRHSLHLPTRYSRGRLTQPGTFVTLMPTIDFPARRGEILFSNPIGVTLRVVADELEKRDTPSIELWPWANVLNLTAAKPTPEERALLMADSS